MGIFKKVKDGLDQATDAQQFAQQTATQQAGAG
jgi:hypothetical protein